MSMRESAEEIMRQAHWYEEHACMITFCEHTGWNCDSPACSNMVCGVHQFKCPYCGFHFCVDCSQAHYESCGDRDPVLDILNSVQAFQA